MDGVMHACSNGLSSASALFSGGRIVLLILSVMALLLQAETAAPPSGPQKARILGNPAQWFSADHYPAEAAAARKAGRVSTILRVDDHGAVAGCTISTSSGFAPLDKGTCDLIVQHLSFSPATDSAGKPIASDYPLSVTWHLAINFARETSPTCPTLLPITPETAALSQEQIDQMHLPPDMRLCA
ncbi:TonB family protein [Sphingomonas desiccabilis]|uniref:TonB family protein n=1 Tax=Sphingomonas desiccabilis TaxID=429134 RepID=A0A4Q2J0A8_9SPHN|nr:TonB family protein [Sphingomonas desiccabilis]